MQWCRQIQMCLKLAARNGGIWDQTSSSSQFCSQFCKQSVASFCLNYTFSIDPNLIFIPHQWLLSILELDQLSPLGCRAFCDVTSLPASPHNTVQVSIHLNHILLGEKCCVTNAIFPYIVECHFMSILCCEQLDLIVYSTILT